MADKKISQLTGATTPLAGTEVLPIVQGGNTVKVSAADITAGRAISASGLTLSGGVAGGVVYLDGSKVATTVATDLFFNGNFGIGTATPGAKLDVLGTGRVTGVLTVQGPTNTAKIDLTGAAAATDGAYSIASKATRALSITDEYAGAERIGIDQNGNVNVVGGNLKLGTAAKGIDFSANTGTAGMTSELLNWYEEGTWTPSLSRINPSGFSYTAGAEDKGYYTRIGNIVHVFGSFNGTFSGGSDLYKITQLPFNQKTGISYVGSIGHVVNISAGADVGPIAAIGSNVSEAVIYTGNPTSGNIQTFSLTYFV